MTRFASRIVAGLLALAAIAAPALAHKASDSYLAIEIEDTRIRGQWDIALRDLEIAIGLDANGDGEITWGELRARHDAIDTYALGRLALRSGGNACTLHVTEHLVDEHTDGAYSVLRFQAACPTRAEALEIDYRLLFDIDPQHRGLLKLTQAGATRTAVIAPESSTQRFALGATSWLDALAGYFKEGVWHIWIGFDHILFLVSLLLPAVLVREHGRWGPVPALRPALWEVAKVVTAFTIAHSITLALATLGVVDLPSRLVEATIALSVVLAAANNLVPVVRERLWLVAFAFGLVHGFGFASVLTDLGLPTTALATALVGFNLGVEAGQLAIVAVFLPIAFALRRGAFYRRVIAIGGSILIGAIALVWFFERALDLKLF